FVGERMEASTVREFQGHGDAMTGTLSCNVRNSISFDVLGRGKVSCVVVTGAEQTRILNKVGELQRRSLYERLVELLNDANVPFTDLWADRDSTKGLHEILQRRNA